MKRTHLFAASGDYFFLAPPYRTRGEKERAGHVNGSEKSPGFQQSPSWCASRQDREIFSEVAIISLGRQLASVGLHFYEPLLDRFAECPEIRLESYNSGLSLP